MSSLRKCLCYMLAIPLLQKHMEFLIDRYAHFNSPELNAEGMDGAFSYELVKPMLSAIIERGAGHLTQVQVFHNAAVKQSTTNKHSFPSVGSSALGCLSSLGTRAIRRCGG